jgi:lysophospholipase L1-like esterase
VNVIFFGDSIFFGQYVSPHVAWVTRLSAEVAQRFPGRFVVANPSVNGSTTRQALERMAFDVQAHEPVLLAVQFGLNDCNRWETDRGLPRVSLDAFGANLAEIVARGQAFGARSVLLHANHPTQKGGRYDADNRAYNERIREIADASGAELVDVERGFAEAGLPLEELLLADGLHLAEAGHDLYLELVGPRVLAALEAATVEAGR